MRDRHIKSIQLVAFSVLGILSFGTGNSVICRKEQCPRLKGLNPGEYQILSAKCQITNLACVVTLTGCLKYFKSTYKTIFHLSLELQVALFPQCIKLQRSKEESECSYTDQNEKLFFHQTTAHCLVNLRTGLNLLRCFLEVILVQMWHDLAYLKKLQTKTQ